MPVTPVGGGDLRGVGIPEGSFLEKLVAVAAVKEGGVFTLAGAIPLHAGGGEFREGLEDCLELEREGLLQADNIRCVLADGVHHQILAVFPTVLPVVGQAVTDIEGHHVHGLAGGYW